MTTNPHIVRLIADINAQMAEHHAEREVWERAESDAIESGSSPDDASVAGAGGFAMGRTKLATTEAEREQDAAMLTLMRLGWGQDDSSFRQLFTSQFIPDGTREQMDWFNELQRISTSPENAARSLEIASLVDVTELLPQVAVPTLVMHAKDELRAPFDGGRRMAAAIPGARFVPLQSRNHLILGDEPAFARFVEELTGFLRE